ncbi:MAG: helix-turn-helix transcriptional regulator [Myxococcales bacterium]|nr:helix-turn-helix transcriptional regulator [Myxococcales bacterium]
MPTSYGQYCPVARASEILAERWTPLIVRNLMFGAETFSDIARGVPGMSRSMLVKRLEELEDAAIIARRPKARGRGHIYRLSEAGAALGQVIAALSVWGERFIEVTTDHANPAFALWAWSKVQLDHARLPEQRTVVAFTFPREPPSNRYYWLLAERHDAELCYTHPGFDADAEVVADSLAFVQWHRGKLRWRDALRAGSIKVSGRREVLRQLPSWNLHAPRLPAR